jgi:predicted nucleotidyltransferase
MVQEKINTKQDLLVALAKNSETIKSYGVSSLGLFGSFVKEKNNDKSDIDLLVDFAPDKKSFDNFMGLSLFLEDLFGRKVEIVTPLSLSKFIGPHILKEVQYVNL